MNIVMIYVDMINSAIVNGAAMMIDVVVLIALNSPIMYPIPTNSITMTAMIISAGINSNSIAKPAILASMNFIIR